jgi:putative transposase
MAVSSLNSVSSVWRIWRSTLSPALEYEAELYGRYFAKIGRYEPTSQVCSACGVKDGPKPLNVRVWTCPHCGTVTTMRRTTSWPPDGRTG